MPEDHADSIHVDAPPEVVYDLVADVTRMGEWSPECVGATYNEGATPGAPGARFTGHNKIGDFEWTAPCEVRRAERPSLFEFAAASNVPEATVWTFELEAAGTGTRVTERFHAPLLNIEGSPSNFEGRDELLRKGVRATLANLKLAARSGVLAADTRVVVGDRVVGLALRLLQRGVDGLVAHEHLREAVGHSVPHALVVADHRARRRDVLGPVVNWS